MTFRQKRKEQLGMQYEISPPPTKRRVQSTINQKQVASFFTPTSRKSPSRTTWRSIRDSLLIAKYEPEIRDDHTGPTKRTKIAAFDLDCTLIISVSKKKIGKDAADWKWWAPIVPGELRKLFQNDYQVIIISNQAGLNLKHDPKTVKSDQKRLSDFKTKVNAILESLDLPTTLYAATQKDLYRKPRNGMWTEMLEDYDLDEGDGVNLVESFFVGDAAGRQGDSDGMGKRDFASSDRDFASNTGLKFMTPEEYFLKAPARFFKRDFDPSLHLQIADKESKPKTQRFSRQNDQDLVLLCGSPGVGKSTFFWNKLSPLGYERVNQDVLKSRDKCVQKAEEFLVHGRSVAVDNTNADAGTRAYWIRLAEKLKLPIRCVHLVGDAKLCEHNDTVRALSGSLMNPESRTMLPTIAFTGFASRFGPPRAEEGFQDITTIEFEFCGTDEQKAIWSRFWI